MISLLYAALGFGVGLTAATAVGTFALLRWTGELEADKDDNPSEIDRKVSNNSSTSEVDGSGYRLDREVLETFTLPIVVSVEGRRGISSEAILSLPYHSNVREFVGDYETVRDNDNPDAAELEKLWVMTPSEDPSE